MPTTNFEGFVFKLSGVSLGAGSTIPVGTSIQKVVLTTRDLVTETSILGQRNDALGLTPGESALVQINGVTIASAVPAFRAAYLNTDAGQIAVLVFTDGTDSYALAARGTDFDAPTRTVAPSVLNTISPNVVSQMTYGLQPEDANTYTAQSFNAEFGGGVPSAITGTIGAVQLFDTDLVRGNGEIAPAIYEETLTTIQFSDGTILGGVRTLQAGGYSGYVTAFSYLFDLGALAASGHDLGDVQAVLGSFAFDHALNWDEVGFTLQSGPVVNGGGDDAPPPPPPPPPLNVINGTSRADVLRGTAAADAIRGYDGNDTMTGRGGDDVFIFGTDSRSGRRSTDTITDYQVGQDVIGLEAGASVRNIVDNGNAIVITLVGDNDRIVIQGAALTVADITTRDTPNSFDLL
jgi:Ca2+-binding RTX toxin-like protein